MNNFELARPTYAMMLDLANKLVADIPGEKMCDQPVPGRVMNHPAFLLGHLAWANDNGLARLGLMPTLGEQWKEMFAMGAKPQGERALYPPKEVLLKTLADVHQRLGDAIANASPEKLAEPAPERIRSRFPTIAHMVLGLMTSHYGNHLGQLSAWRRASGYPSIF